MSIEILTTTEKVNRILELKNELADSLSALGIKSNQTDSLETLAQSIPNRIMHGSFEFAESTESVNRISHKFENLPFNPQNEKFILLIQNLSVLDKENTDNTNWNDKNVNTSCRISSIELDTGVNDICGVYTGMKRSVNAEDDTVSFSVGAGVINNTSDTIKVLSYDADNNNSFSISFPDASNIFFAPVGTYYYTIIVKEQTES